MSLFKKYLVIDIEHYLLSFLDFKSLRQLFELNKYYNSLIKNYHKTKKYYDFFCSFPKDKKPIIEDIIKKDDIDIFREYDIGCYPFDNQIRNHVIKLIIKNTSINLLNHICKFGEYTDYIIEKAFEYDNAIICKIYRDYITNDENYRKYLGKCLQNDSINILTTIFEPNIRSLSIMDRIIENDKVKLFNGFVIPCAMKYYSKLIFKLILKKNAFNIFRSLDSDIYSNHIINALGCIFSDDILNYLEEIQYFNNDNFCKIFRKFMLKKRFDHDIDNIDEIEEHVDYEYFYRLTTIADGINFDFTQLDLKNLLLESVRANNYVVIRFIYKKREFNFSKYKFPEQTFDDDILFITARAMKHVWIAQMLLFED